MSTANLSPLKIVVTGVAGKIGQVVVEELLSHGHIVLGVDRVRPARLKCRFMEADLTDGAAVRDVLTGAEAVVHLAAIPGPLLQTPTATFENNVLSTYHLVETAAALRMKRVVLASSLFTIGWAEEASTYWPKTVPVDESVELTPYEAYGLSKVVGEEIAACASRRTGLVTVSLRMANVIVPEAYFAFPWPAPTRERGVRFVMWPYVDVRDAARACRLAVTVDLSGHEAFFIAASDTRFDVPTMDLLRELAPDTLQVTAPLTDCGTVVSIEKARRLLGYQPVHSWRDAQAPVVLTN